MKQISQFVRGIIFSLIGGSKRSQTLSSTRNIDNNFFKNFEYSPYEHHDLDLYQYDKNSSFDKEDINPQSSQRIYNLRRKQSNLNQQSLGLKELVYVNYNKDQKGDFSFLSNTSFVHILQVQEKNTQSPNITWNFTQSIYQSIGPYSNDQSNESETLVTEYLDDIYNSSDHSIDSSQYQCNNFSKDQSIDISQTSIKSRVLREAGILIPKHKYA